MGGYPQNPRGNRPTPAGWTGAVSDPGSPSGGNGPGNSQPYPRRDPDEGSWFWGAVHGAEHFAESAYHSAVAVVDNAEETAIRVAHVAEAIYLATDYADDAIRDKIRMDIEELKKAFIPGLVMSLGILAITTLAGASVAGLLVGVLTAGAGAVPAAVAGGELGLDAGFLILDAMGIGFLLREVFDGISTVFNIVKSAMGIAWNAGSDPKRPPMADIDEAAHGLAGAAAEMVNLLLQGVMIWIMAESGVARAGKLAKGAGKLRNPATLAARGTEILSELKTKPAEMRAALTEGAAELEGRLRRAGEFTQGLADFIKGKFEQILKNVTEDAGKKAEELKRTGGGETEGSVGVGDQSGARRSPTTESAPKPNNPKVGWGKGQVPCFPAGTLVQTPQGLKPIDEIQAGDRVFSFDIQSDCIQAKAVTGIYHGTSRHMVRVETAASLITATAHHPIWDHTSGEWREAMGLTDDSVLFGFERQTLPVKVVAVESLPNPVPTYNLHVEGTNNFFAGLAGILVHNGGPSLDAPGYSNYVLRDANGDVYYSGMYGPNQTPADVQYRHANNNDRFNEANGDTMDVSAGTRTYGESRRMEHETAVENDTYIGRQGSSYRGNRQYPLSDRNYSKYYARDAC